MLEVEKWAEIRKMSRVDGLSQREISRRCGLNRRTVKRALEATDPRATTARIQEPRSSTPSATRSGTCSKKTRSSPEFASSKRSAPSATPAAKAS
ncbi:MAG: sigma-70 region 4 domain-containing protein [Solirubrobacterales bacterium]|nr:sigma-70 region 4 domain-containing protein [Solirubrobacterales bacterium]